MPNYNLNLAGVPDGTAGAALVAADGQTHSNGPGFDTINGGMFNTAGGATDGFLVIDEALPDTYSGDLDLTFISAWGAAGLSLSSNADFTESIIIQVNSAGILTVQHRTIAGGFGPTLGSANAVAGLSSGDPIPRVHYEVSPTHLLVTLGGVTVFDAAHTTNSETFNIQAYRATVAASSTSGYHVNSNVLVDPADNAKTYVEGPNILLLPANVNKTYADGEYDVVTSIINNDATTASSSSTMSVGFSMSTDSAMAHGSDHVVTVSNPPVTPTDLNTTYTNGLVSLVPTVTGTGPFTLTFPISRLDKAAGTYAWTLDIGGNTLVSDPIPYTIAANGTEHYYDTFDARTGEYEDPAFDGLTIGDNLYVVRTSGNTDYPVDISIGAYPVGEYQFWSQDQSDNRWSEEGSITVTAAANNPATGLPAISGNAVEGQTLTCDTSGIADADGLGAFSYQWYRGVAVISGATASTYTLVNGDVGSAIHVDVSFTDGQSNSEGPLSSTNTAVVTAAPDTTDPVITLLGSSNITIAHGSTYTDAGATAVDDTDGDITGNISVTGSVDTNTLGDQVLSYDVSDAAGNAATTVTRTVTVTDQAIPSIALNGTQTVTHEAGDTYTDAGATASDAVDGDLTGSISVSGSVDSATPGSYTLDYDVSDAAGNAAVTVTRTVNVVDTTAPVITLTGPATINRSVGEVYTELGATWIDAVDGAGDAAVGGDTVDTSTEGTYTVTYDISDNAGNAATQVTRSVVVTVADVTPDQMSLGADVIDAEPGATTQRTFTITGIDPGETVNVVATGSASVSAATGQLNDQITVSLDASASLDAIVTGGVSINGVSDSFQITTRSAIGPSVAPTINTGGSTSITLTVGDTYSDPNWSASDDLGAVDVDWPAGTIDTSSAGTFTRTASATNAVDTVTADYTVTVVEPVVDYVDPREILKVAKSNDLVFLHDGSEIPETAPKSPNSIAYKGFQILGLSENEVIQQYWVLIEGQIVEPGESVNGLRYESALTNNVDRVKVLLSGGTSGLSYRLTLRFKTQHVPLDERSQDFEVKPL